MSQDNPGRYLENLVQKWFDNSDDVSIMLTRLPDSRSARNLIKAQNADFLISSREFGAWHLECKSVGGKKEQLKVFRQYPLMKRWALAGVPGLVLVHFYDLKKLALFDVTTAEKPEGQKHWNIPTDCQTIVIGSDREEDVYAILNSMVRVMRRRLRR